MLSVMARPALVWRRLTLERQTPEDVVPGLAIGAATGAATL
jgi:hypothetical protein